MGFLKKLQAKQAAREHEEIKTVIEAAEVAGLLQLGPEEKIIVAAFAMGAKDLKRGGVLRAAALMPLGLPHGYLVVLTDQRLVVLEQALQGLTPKRLVLADPRRDIKVEKFGEPRPNFTGLSIRCSDGSYASLEFLTSSWGEEAKTIDSELESLSN